MRIFRILPGALLALATLLTTPACQQTNNPDRDGSTSTDGSNTTADNPEGTGAMTQPDRDAATGDNADGMLTDTAGGAKMSGDNSGVPAPAGTTDPSGGTGSGNAKPGSSSTGENGTGNGGH